MTEQQPYEVLKTYPGFEVRRYPGHVLAEVTVAASFEEAGNLAFRTLLGYITGQNQPKSSIAMTAPVLQQSGTTMAMTAPVITSPGPSGSQTVAFVLPASIDPESVPAPTDPRVHIRAMPQTRAAASRHSGRWSQASYDRHCASLLQALAEHGLTPAGPPRFARYDPPFKPWFLRRNEVIIDLA